MKTLLRSLMVFSIFFYFLFSSGMLFAQSSHIKVAIYDDAGGSTAGPINIELSLADTSFYVTTRVTADDIRAGILQNFDVLVQPGGSGSGQAAALETSGLDSIRQFVRRGGGILGICAGSYLLSSDYTWSLHILNTKVIDKAHWNRGNAPLVIRFNSTGKKFFNLSNDTVTIGYFQGPVMAPAGVDTLPGYVELSVFQTEIALNGAIPGLMIGKTAFAQSCYGAGRVFAMSPHPEKQDELRFMVARAVNWLASDDNFTAFASPMENEKWLVGSPRKVQWVSGGGVDTMHIDYSTDNGSTWSLLAAAATSPYSWMVPNTPSAFCKLRILSNNRNGIGDTISFSIDTPPPAIISAADGNWSSSGTWIGGMIPGANDDVIIGVGHTVIVDVESNCNSLSFGDALSRLGLNANLNIYGNFNRFDVSANPFYSTMSLWTPGAKLVFKGDSEVQTITNLNTTSTSPYPLRFNEMVVDKNFGKVTTESSNYKLGIGTSLEVINGTFELGSTDDIEGRDVSGTATTPTIIVQADGTFNMVGSSSVIRRGNFTGEETGKVGKLIVYGTANLAFGSTSRVSFSGIDIENGGYVSIPTSRGTVANSFNCGVITIKDGGKLKNSLNTAFWYNNITVPPSIIINNGGEYEASSSLTTLPQGGVTQDNGSSIRYSFGGNITLPASIASYKTLILSNSGVKSLGVATTIDEALQVSGTASLGLGGFTLTYNPVATLRYGVSGQATAQTTSDIEWPELGGPQSVQIYNSGGVTLHADRTISRTLTLTLGTFDNNGSTNDKVLSIANGATIARAKGILSVVPSFSSKVNLRYSSTTAHVATGLELPITSSMLNDLTLSGTMGITLSSNTTVNGTLTFSGDSLLYTGANTLTLGPTATITGERAGRYVNGILTTTQVVGTGASTFGGIGVSLAAGMDDLGSVSVTRAAGLTGIVSVEGNQGIARRWTITSTNPPTSGRDLTLTWVSTDDNGKTFNGTNYAEAWRYNGVKWDKIGTAMDVSSNDPRSLTVTTTAFSDWTVSDQNSQLPVELVSFSASVAGTGVTLTWSTATEKNNYGFYIERTAIGESWNQIGFVKGAGTTLTGRNYQYTDNSVLSGKYSYRLRQVDFDGATHYSSAVDVDLTVPAKFELSQNYPNPFNPSTVIRFTVAEQMKTSLRIYSVTGKLVATLFEQQAEPGRLYLVKFDGSQYSSGIYFAELASGSQKSVKKLTLIK